MKTVRQIMAETGAEENIALMKQMLAWPYDRKVYHAEQVAKAFYQRNSREGRNTHLSVGGLDSITLHYFLEEIGLHLPCISCSTLEQKGVQAAHRKIAEEMDRRYAEWEHDHGALTQEEIDSLPDAAERIREQKALDNVPAKPRMVFLQPIKPKVQVIREFGWPVLSKEIAGKIALLQNPTQDNATVRHAILTGETGEYGGWKSESRMQLSRRWLSLFGGADAEGAEQGYAAAPFRVSDRCCYYLKEKPCDDWAKRHNSVPYLGLMASEGGRRQKSLMMHGCNYWGKSTIRSAPFAIFNRQDLLQLALDLKVPVPAEYGEIRRGPGGVLRTTLAQRTGCTMCGFGIQMEKRPNRFDRLREQNPREWEFWMTHVCQDAEGSWYGWGRVLDYIGVEWRNAPGQVLGQLSFDEQEVDPQ